VAEPVGHAIVGIFGLRVFKLCVHCISANADPVFAGYRNATVGWAWCYRAHARTDWK